MDCELTLRYPRWAVFGGCCRSGEICQYGDGRVDIKKKTILTKYSGERVPTGPVLRVFFAEVLKYGVNKYC